MAVDLLGSNPRAVLPSPLSASRVCIQCAPRSICSAFSSSAYRYPSSPIPVEIRGAVWLYLVNFSRSSAAVRAAVGGRRNSSCEKRPRPPRSLATLFTPSLKLFLPAMWCQVSETAENLHRLFPEKYSPDTIAHSKSSVTAKFWGILYGIAVLRNRAAPFERKFFVDGSFQKVFLQEGARRSRLLCL